MPQIIDVWVIAQHDGTNVQPQATLPGDVSAASRARIFGERVYDPKKWRWHPATLTMADPKPKKGT